MISTDEFFKEKDETFFLKTLAHQLLAQTSVTFHEFCVATTSSCIPNQLRNVYPISRRSWYIAAKVWKIYNFEIEVVVFVIDSGTEMTTGVKFEVQVQK